MRFNSFMMEADIIQEPVHWFSLEINGLVSIWYRPPSWKSENIDDGIRPYAIIITLSPFTLSFTKLCYEKCNCRDMDDDINVSLICLWFLLSRNLIQQKCGISFSVRCLMINHFKNVTFQIKSLSSKFSAK